MKYSLTHCDLEKASQCRGVQWSGVQYVREGGRDSSADLTASVPVWTSAQ